jgi:H/ACA ribonucleoprotein complex non-core subunit NAF1
MNYGAGPSRPPPIPYDDPYSDSFTSVPIDGDGEDGVTFGSNRNEASRHDLIRDRSDRSAHTNDRNSDSGPRHHNTRGRGRGGSRNRQPDRGRRGRGKGTPQHAQPGHPSFTQRSGSHNHSPNLPPASSFSHPYTQQSVYGGGGERTYGAPLMAPQSPVFGFGMQNPFPGVQPHINPRFANQLGFNFSQVPQIPQMPPGAGSPSSSEQYHPDDANLRSAIGYPRWGEESG